MRAVDGAIQVSLFRPLHVIGYDQVEFAVTVVIDPCGAGGKLIGTGQTGRFGDIAECSVAIVVEEMALPERGDEYVVMAVVVVVADCGAQAEHRYRQSRLASNVGKGAIVIVMVELRRGCGL